MYIKFIGKVLSIKLHTSLSIKAFHVDKKNREHVHNADLLKAN